MGFSSVLGFLASNHSLSHWERSIIYTCNIYKIRRESPTQFWILKFIILMAIKLNILIWIEIRESPSLSDNSRFAVHKDKLSPRSNCLVWMTISLKNWDLPSTSFISSSTYPTRLKFELDGDSRSGVLKVATSRASLGSRIDTCHNFRRVKKGPLH